ncbi:MAG: hypothetical protein GKR88_17505 [Flavobacteriaceae bacterium]|nr:MAG: hypothetical protein GKR88_17505 [Flavobacteriaceae bacterium]
MSVSHITTPLDTAVLDSKEQYVFYHTMLDFSLKELVVSTQRQQICNSKEIIFFKQYCDLLLYSVEAMRIKYMYDAEENMKIDLTDSGFPNYLEFRYLYNDLQLRKNYLGKLISPDILKEEFLHTLLHKKKPVEKDKLFQAVSVVYYTSVKEQYIFNRFVQGKIIDAPKNITADLLTSWSFYDVTTNRPYICFMYFDFAGDHMANYKRRLYNVLKSNADRDMKLDTMAYAIDKKLPEIHPKHIKRIDLGPLHTVFAKDKNEITHTILEAIGKKEIALASYALSLTVDEVRSGGTFNEGSFFAKQKMQRWNKIATQKYVLAPHRIIQLLYNKVPEVLHNLTKPPIQVADLKINKK